MKRVAAKPKRQPRHDDSEPQVRIELSPDFKLEVAENQEGSLDPQAIRKAIEEAFGPPGGPPLRAYRRDPWRLLNATEEEIRAAAGEKWYKPEEVDELVSMLEALRTLYYWGGIGDPVDLAQVFPEAEARLRQGLRALYSGIFETTFFLDGAKIRRGLRRVDGLPKGPPFIVVDLNEALSELIDGLETLTPRKVFVCGQCGRIGPAERSDKRYCSNVCRAQASRRRRR